MDWDAKKMAKPGLIVAALLFGSIGIITHFISAPATLIVAVRGVVAIVTLILIMIALRHKLDRDAIESNIFVLLLSGTCLGLNWLFLFEAYKITEVSIAVLCNNMAPALLILIAPLFFTERLNLVKIGCVGLAIVGLVLSSGVITVGLSEGETLGVIYGMVSAVFATFMIVFNRMLRSITAMDKTLFQMVVASAILIAYTLVTVDMSNISLTYTDLTLMICLGVFQTAIAFTLYFGSVVHLRSDTFAMCAYIEPVSALILSAFILGEDLSIIGWIGAGLILGSTYICEKLGNRPGKHILSLDFKKMS